MCMGYTDEEIEEIAWAAYLQSAGLTTQENVRDAAKAVLDAVLPGYTQRIQAETLQETLDAYEREVMPMPHNQTHYEAFSWLVKRAAKAHAIVRAAALATPVEP